MTTALKAAAAAVREIHRTGPVLADFDGPLDALLAIVDSLPSDGVVVSRALLERVLQAGRDGYGHTRRGERAKSCDGCAALEELEGVLG